MSRIVAEVGVAMMIGGNIKWHTRTITTAISLETKQGQFAMGIAFGNGSYRNSVFSKISHLSAKKN